MPAPISLDLRMRIVRAGLMIGRHLVFDGQDYLLHLTAPETKVGRPYIAAVPSMLTPYIDRWITVHRPTLQPMSPEDRQASSAKQQLWLDRWGQPMSGRAIQRQIGWRTEQAFGKAIRPHLFRDCAVTELVDAAPDEIGIAPDLLGHADLRTTRKHYIQARRMTAHVRVAQMLARRRAAAARGIYGPRHAPIRPCVDRYTK